MADQDDVDFTTLPLEQRASHKVWKARLNAYQELNNLFTKSSVISPPNDVANYWLDPELFASYIVDSNVVAQENAIIALHTLLEYISQVPNVSTSKLRLQWIPPLVEKGLSSSRAATKAKATDCIMLLTQSDTSIQQTVNLMLPSLSNKLPRLVSSCVKCLATIIEEFGFINVSDINILLSEILEPLPKLSSHADRNVRSETMNLILQIYKWFGKELLQELLLEKLKPIQQRDLSRMFEKYEGTIPPKQQPRLFQWAVPAQSDNNSTLQTDKDGDTLMGNAVDPFELLPPSVILDKFPADFQTRISSTKWKDRVEALEEIHNNVLKPVKKLAHKNQDYSDYLRVLANVIQKDANVQAVTIAANSVQLLCNSLRSNFTRSYGAIVLVPLLERTKEKKPSVNEAICSALDAVATYCGFDDCLEETLNYMKHKTPQVRIECTKFLTRMLQGWKSDGPLQNQLLFKLLPEVTTAVLKIVNDTQPTTRNTGFECFATLMKLVGERELADPLEKLDNLKKKKIYEYYEKVEVATGLEHHHHHH
uniref:Protein Stu2p/Alp14p n=1 Tax=Lachancea kluyveri (strain ATCC 58438 / CBS 3082 / BCRC 21498 / NBRC 1685 / JCM 7257 / NCYC 543 / NRRL Y-12651) TaxID=226302 RepID=A0A493R6X7_LACK1|nr:Chain E, Protein Stu2p/Alp14p [Lachancea kluyveri NRRL Y-12651]6MZE_L Chain L, Protein Stu2p/Alp14p [Lachancea kluyveri NRRL Y-12651]6MZE_S Chain S, Protein Stu2p/Alp14p [Lachancea kluyveri NRRL Y-12651]6MZE_Z Chain Z, Protein Stu2p/Alp14p [Lachancea kluyveri NRRL Y-12651]